jgi:uncharacterized protein YqeY
MDARQSILLNPKLTIGHFNWHTPIVNFASKKSKFELTKKTPIDEKDHSQLLEETINLTSDEFEQFEKGGREDLVADEKAELAIVEEFLPEMMSEDEIRKVVEAKKSEMNADKMLSSIFSFRNFCS